MNMQDKEFDDLFRSKLDNFETEPSAQIWTNIDAELDGNGRKKGLFAVLRIAASIIVLVTAGLLFIPKKGNVNSNHHAKNYAKNQAAPIAVKPAEIAPGLKAAKDDHPADIQAPVNRIARVHHAKKIETAAAQKEPNVQIIAKKESVKVDEQPVLASVSQKTDVVTQPGTEISLTVKNPDTDKIAALKSNPVSVQTPAAKQVIPSVKKHGIHNMGDLVNLVIAKVDKRKDKVIEFTDTDDDESTITGIHIGGIRFKKGE
jgi:hypothetical protein